MANQYSLLSAEAPTNKLAQVEPQEFNEYNDPDATACAVGDYNTWEENQCFSDDY